MKQSVGLIILQFFGIALGLISTFWVAGSISSDLYAVVGIQTVISSITTVFSNTGIETYAIRNVLAWREANKDDIIKITVSRAILIRTFIALVLTLPLYIYIKWLSIHKFNGQHYKIFILMVIFSVFSALNDSFILILKAFNRYLVAAFISYFTNVFGRIIALIIFLKYGFFVYIYLIISLPIITTIPVIFMLKEWLKFKGILDIKQIIKDLKLAREFGLSAYINYLFNYFDQLAVSILLTPEILGSYTIGKRFWSITKQFIENIFDPLTQNLIKYKNTPQKINVRLIKIYKLKNIFFSFSLLIFPIIFCFLDEFLKLLNIYHYPYLLNYILFIYISNIIFIQFKIKYDLIALFYKAKIFLFLTLIQGVISILFFTIITLTRFDFLFLNLIITNIILLIITNTIFYKYKFDL